ncbi:MAG: hypothetical protein SNG34_06875 [Rikenellaceae bacterium]
MEFESRDDSVRGSAYQAPNLEVIDIEYEGLICSSVDKQLGSYNGGDNSVGM